MSLAEVFDLYEAIYCKIKNYFYGSSHSSLYGHRRTKKSGSVYDLPLTRVCSRSSVNVVDVAVVVIVVVVALNDRYKTLNGLFRRLI